MCIVKVGASRAPPASLAVSLSANLSAGLQAARFPITLVQSLVMYIQILPSDERLEGIFRSSKH